MPVRPAAGRSYRSVAITRSRWSLESTGNGNQLNADPLAGHLFVFLNKSNTLAKILYWDGDGFAIWYKRLEVGTFRFPARVGDNKSINVTRTGLSMILEGIDLEKLPKQKRFSQKTP